MDAHAPALTGEQARFVKSARVGHLASASRDGRPHVVPVCFALIEERVYVGLDSKPKSVDHLRLRRVRNILENPRVSFLVDRYSEDWTRLGWVLMSGRAGLVESTAERAEAIHVLRGKYEQYADLLPDEAPVLRIGVERTSAWGDLTPWR